MSIPLSPYAAIRELEEASPVSKANDLLGQGFVLIKVIEKTNADGSTSIWYVMGRPREVGTGQQQQQPSSSAKSSQKGWTSPPAAAAPEQKALESLKWKKFDKGEGEWAFFLTATRELLPELKPAAGIIERLKSKEGTEVTVGSHRYKVSKERFLNRFPAKKQQL